MFASCVDCDDLKTRTSPLVLLVLSTLGLFSGTQTRPCCSCRLILSWGTLPTFPFVRTVYDQVNPPPPFSCFSSRRMQRLGASKITQVDFVPREMVSYNKETQTPLNAHLSEGESCCTPPPPRLHTRLQTLQAQIFSYFLWMWSLFLQF